MSLTSASAAAGGIIRTQDGFHKLVGAEGEGRSDGTACGGHPLRCKQMQRAWQSFAREAGGRPSPIARSSIPGCASSFLESEVHGGASRGDRTDAFTLRIYYRICTAFTVNMPFTPRPGPPTTDSGRPQSILMSPYPMVHHEKCRNVQIRGHFTARPENAPTVNNLFTVRQYH